MTGVAEAQGLKFMSGKFEGRSMNQIAHQYPEYIVWCYKSVLGKMGIPHELYVWADNLVKAKRASIEARIRDEQAARDFESPKGTPWSVDSDDHRRGAFVGDSGSNRLTPFQAALEQQYGLIVKEDKFGNRTVFYPPGHPNHPACRSVAVPVLDPNAGTADFLQEAASFLDDAAGEDNSTSFLDGIL